MMATMSNLNAVAQERDIEMTECGIPWFKDQAELIQPRFPDDPPNVVGRYRDYDGLWHVVIDTEVKS